MALLQACSSADSEETAAPTSTSSAAPSTTSSVEVTSEEETSEEVTTEEPTPEVVVEPTTTVEPTSIYTPPPPTPETPQPGIGYYTLTPAAYNSGAGIAIINADGTSVSNRNARTRYPALSLSKLFIGYWLLQNTTGYEEQVRLMVELSDDGVASAMDRMFPQAIPEIAAQFGLVDTSRNGFWGNSTTTAVDMVVFLSHILAHDPNSLLLTYMANTAPIASDGYAQNFGTAVIPGVIGTKFGWSDNRAFHATVSYGSNFVVAAFGHGSPSTLTAAVQNSVVQVTG